MLPFGRVEKTPGSVPLGIQEKVTRSSIRRKNGRSGAFLTALAGRSAALASPVDASAANASAAAAIAVLRRDISNTPKLTSGNDQALACDNALFGRGEKPHLSPARCRDFHQETEKRAPTPAAGSCLRRRAQPESDLAILRFCPSSLSFFGIPPLGLRT